MDDKSTISSPDAVATLAAMAMLGLIKQESSFREVTDEHAKEVGRKSLVYALALTKILEEHFYPKGY